MLVPPCSHRGDEPTRVAPLAGGQPSSQRSDEPTRIVTLANWPAVPLRGDEPTRVVVTLADEPGGESKGEIPQPSPPDAQPEAYERSWPSERPVSYARVIRRRASSSGGVGRYNLRNPEHAATQITLPPPRSRPPRKPRASHEPPGTETQDQLLAEEHFEIAELLLARGNVRAAVFEAQRGMRLGPPRPEQRVLYAWLLYQRSGGGARVRPHVWQHLERALEEGPACAAAHYYKGALLMRSGRTAEALAYFERAVQLDPSDGRAQAELELFTLRTLG